MLCGLKDFITFLYVIFNMTDIFTIIIKGHGRVQGGGGHRGHVSPGGCTAYMSDTIDVPTLRVIFGPRFPR